MDKCWSNLENINYKPNYVAGKVNVIKSNDTVQTRDTETEVKNEDNHIKETDEICNKENNITKVDKISPANIPDNKMSITEVTDIKTTNMNVNATTFVPVPSSLPDQLENNSCDSSTSLLGQIVHLSSSSSGGVGDDQSL